MLAHTLARAVDAVEAEAQVYFAIRIWSAPFALANYAFLGWFMRLPGVCQLLQVLIDGTGERAAPSRPSAGTPEPKA